MNLSNSAEWVIITSAKLTAMTGSIIVPVINFMRDEFGVDPASAGFIVTMHALFAALSYTYFKNRVHTVGTKKMLVAGLLFYGVCGGSGLFIQSYALLLVTRALLGIGLAAVYVSTTALLNLYTEEELNNLKGLRGSSTAFGSINWPVIGGFLGVFSWHYPFALYLLCIPLAFLTMRVVPEIDIREGEIKEKEIKKNLNPVSGSKPIIYGVTVLENILLFTILVFVPPLLEKMNISYYSVLSPFYIGFLIIFMMISSVLGSSLYLKTREIPSSIIIFLTLGLWTGAFAALFQGNTLIIVSSLLLFSIGQGLYAPVVGKMIDVFSPDGVTHLRILGLTGQFLAPLIFFPVVLLSGVTEVFLAAGILCGAFLLVYAGILLKMNFTL
jgi:ACDE family multidrug resistance protein